MISKYLYVIFIVQLYSSSTVCDPLLAFKSLVIDPGATLMNYIHFNDTKSELIKCAVSYESNNVSVTVPLPLTEERRVTLNLKDKTTKDRIIPLYRGICGFNLWNFGIFDPEKYTFQFQYRVYSEIYEANKTFSVSIYNLTSPVEVRYFTVDLGDELEIKCGKRTAARCTLFNPAGEIIEHYSPVCDYKIKYITLAHIGKWECHSGFTQRMESQVEFIEVKLFEGWRMATWYKESDGYGMIGCKYFNHNTQADSQPKFCQLIRPDKNIFTITKIGATERYSSVGTNLTDYKCQLEFPLPPKSDEIGTWQCLFAEIGGHVSVHTHQRIVSESSYAREKIVPASLESSVNLQCQVPYLTEDCYLISPNGTIYTGGTIPDFSIGKCGIYIEKVQKTDYGKWKCYYSAPNSAKDDVITIDLKHFEDIIAITSRVEADEGDEVELLCKMTTAVGNCAFEDPSGQRYHVSPAKKSKKISYVGKGFNYGECGMLIQNITKGQEGAWKCLMRQRLPPTRQQKIILTANITLIVNEKTIVSSTTSASTIGIAIGASVACITIIPGLIYHFCRKRQRRQITDEDENVTIPLRTVTHTMEINSESTGTVHL